MPALTLSNPLFATYAVAAALMILKTLSMAWLTVFQMIRVKGGYRAPEDLRKTPLNPHPSPEQLAPNEVVERARRIHMNDLENIPFFLVAGLLFVLTEPSLLFAQVLLYGYVATRFLHFLAYVTARSHDLRAALWTPGSLIIIFMAVRVLWVACEAAFSSSAT